MKASYGYEETEVHGDECHHQQEAEEQFDLKQQQQHKRRVCSLNTAIAS